VAAGVGGCFITILVIGVVGLLVFAIIYGAKKERERREAMRAYAARMGLRFTERDDGLESRMADFPPFAVGHSRVGLNLMEGEATLGGMRMTYLAGDYQYKVTTSNGKSTQTTVYNMSFIAVRPVLAVPEELTVREEGLFDKIGAFLGFDDIDFESSEFSKRFHVKCSDRRFAFDLFDPRMMEFFLASRPPRIHARGGVLVLDYGTRRWETGEFDATRAWADGFFLRIPRHVRAARLPASEHAGDPIINPTGEGARQ
jgi:hypothetical protein